MAFKASFLHKKIELNDVLFFQILFHQSSLEITLYNVCSVHRGMFSTSRGYHEYIGGILWVHRGVQYIGGISWCMWGYYEYIGGCSVHRGMFSTSGGYQDACRGYHEYIGRCSVHWGILWVHWGMFSTLGVSRLNWKVLPTCSPTYIMIALNVLNIPRCTRDIPWCTHGIPLMYWTSPNVLMISPRCTEHPQCTEHPLMYWTHIIQGGNWKILESTKRSIMLLWTFLRTPKNDFDRPC